MVSAAAKKKRVCSLPQTAHINTMHTHLPPCWGCSWWGRLQLDKTGVWGSRHVTPRPRLMPDWWQSPRWIVPLWPRQQTLWRTNRQRRSKTRTDQGKVKADYSNWATCKQRVGRCWKEMIWLRQLSAANVHFTSDIFTFSNPSTKPWQPPPVT